MTGSMPERTTFSPPKNDDGYSRNIVPSIIYGLVILFGIVSILRFEIIDMMGAMRFPTYYPRYVIVNAHISTILAILAAIICAVVLITPKAAFLYIPLGIVFTAMAVTTPVGFNLLEFGWGYVTLWMVVDLAFWCVTALPLFLPVNSRLQSLRPFRITPKAEPFSGVIQVN